MQEKKSYIEKAVLIVVIIILAAVIGNKVYSNIKSRQLADQYVEDTVHKTETLVRSEGIPDFEIKVKDKQYASYASDISSSLIRMDRYGFTVEYLKKRLYINDELVYERLEEPIKIPTKPEYAAPAPSTSTGNNYEYTGEYYDPYGVEDYDNADDFADDFADEWAEEFGDGDYDDGYDDAYDYWEEEY